MYGQYNPKAIVYTCLSQQVGAFLGPQIGCRSLSSHCRSLLTSSNSARVPQRCIKLRTVLRRFKAIPYLDAPDDQATAAVLQSRRSSTENECAAEQEFDGAGDIHGGSQPESGACTCCVASDRSRVYRSDLP